MRRLLLLLGIFLILGLVIAYVGPQMFSLGLLTGCDWEVAEIDDQQFESLDALKQAADRQDVAFADLDAEIEFRDPTDGPVEYRPSTCDLQEVESR